MVVPLQAEMMAKDAVQAYVNSCQCESQQDAANVLSMLASICGLALCAVVGKDAAVSRLMQTAFIVSQAIEGQSQGVKRHVH